MSYFFTQLDESLRPRGSRDPIGLEMVWATVGRQMIGNLTTVTAHLDNFVFALLGFQLCRDADETPDWDRFQRFEQVTGIARAQLGRASGILGLRKIQQRQDLETIPIGNRAVAKILENPRQAGLWGLYSTALAASGAIGSERRPTEQGRALAAKFLPSGKAPAWIARIARQNALTQAEFGEIRQSVRYVLAQEAARTELADRLLAGGDKAPYLQQELYVQAMRFLGLSPDNASPRRLLAHLKANSDVLGDYAGRVERLDEALILANTMFYALLACHGKSRSEVAERMRLFIDWPAGRQVSIPAFPEIGAKEWHQRAQRLRDFAQAFAAGDMAGAGACLIAHHETIARLRAGAPWCYWEGDLLKVVSSGGAQPLPSREELLQRFASWAEPRTMGFFLSSFLSILRQSALLDSQTARTEQEIAA